VYVPIWGKFVLAQTFALGWVAFSVWLSLPWFRDLSTVVSPLVAFLMITFVAYIPGYLVALLCASLVLDHPPAFHVTHPTTPLTVLIAARNESAVIRSTLEYLADQDYDGPISVILVDNGSTDDTALLARSAADRLRLDFRVLFESVPGKSNALNTGLGEVETELVATVDADTLLHPSAIRLLVARLLSAPHDVVAVAGHVFVRNSRDGWVAQMQGWDYALGISAIKREQSLFQGTLVAQGAFSVYRSDAVEEVGGWPSGVGEDIMLTWRFLAHDHRVYHEPLAAAFTTVPVTLRTLARQRARWARGMIEAIGDVHPFRQPRLLPRFLAAVDLVVPWLDAAFTFVWLPGLVLALTGRFWIVGPYTVFVVPLSFAAAGLMRHENHKCFDALGLTTRRSRLGFLSYVLTFQAIQSPVSLWGYTRELLHLRKTW
jgi:biofilm PGA synthesis N-glycosyltransferase PgaC